MIVNNEHESSTFGINLAKTLKAGDVVLFDGDLGSGKTFLCREIIRYFCGKDTKITSPTFNLLQTYRAPKFIIYHFDLYRLKSPNEIYELGLEDALHHNLCLIEWPNIVENVLPKPLIKISLKIIEGEKRSYTIEILE